jgi:site-specific recombinase XerC
MTQHVRSLKNGPKHESSWRDLRSPPAANDVIDSLVPLSRSLPKNPEEIAVLLTTLDSEQPSELRAAAMLVLLGLGLKKRELVALDVSDVVLVGSVVCLSVRSRARRAKGQQTFLPVIGKQARVLRAYLTRQHDEAAALTSPLFYSIEHGQADRLRRITASAVSYWLLELRLRARQQLAENGRAPRVSPSEPKPGRTRNARGSRHRQLINGLI